MQTMNVMSLESFYELVKDRDLQVIFFCLVAGPLPFVAYACCTYIVTCKHIAGRCALQRIHPQIKTGCSAEATGNGHATQCNYARALVTVIHRLGNDGRKVPPLSVGIGANVVRTMTAWSSYHFITCSRKVN